MNNRSIYVCDQVTQENEEEMRKMADKTYIEVDRATQRAMELAQEEGVSVRLTTLPLQEHTIHSA